MRPPVCPATKSQPSAAITITEPVMSRTRVHGEGTDPGDDVHRAGLGNGRAHGGHGRRPNFCRGVGDPRDHLGRPRQRVAAVLHARRAGVILPPAYGDLHLVDAGDGVHDPDGVARVLEDPPLLDV